MKQSKRKATKQSKRDNLKSQRELFMKAISRKGGLHIRF